MPTLTINGTEVTVPEGANLIRAAESIGCEVPYFCYHPALSRPANCRMCLVEVEGSPKLMPACFTQVRDGMVVHTDSEKVRVARKGVLEFILVNHPIDCPICDQAGECWLQDNYLNHDFQGSRVRTAKVSKSKVIPVGPYVMLDAERCILCTRCIRFCDEITGTHELTIRERGDRSEVTTFEGQELDNAYSMCTADLCPVGALTNRPFRFHRRVWRLQTTPSICTGCARNCSVHLDHYQQHAERFVPRFNPEVNEYWMCDEGRLSYRRLFTDRLTEIRCGDRVFEYWPASMRVIPDVVKGEGDRRWAMVLSPQSTAEGLLAAAHFGKDVLDAQVYVRGGRPDGDADDFLIRADKNPNNAALNRVTQLISLVALGDLLAAIEEGKVNALWMMGVHLPVDDGLYEQFVGALEGLDLVVLQSPWAGRLGAVADIILPAATHAEQEGTFINCDGVVQTAEPAYPPMGSARADWEIFQHVARRTGHSLPFETRAQALEVIGVVPMEQPELGEGGHLRAPHGPQRPIPQRSATPPKDPDRYRPEVATSQQR